jgi:hypothetical protein
MKKKENTKARDHGEIEGQLLYAYSVQEQASYSIPGGDKMVAHNIL